MATIPQISISDPKTSLYKSPIPLQKSNIRTVENRIIINAPHGFVFNFVTTWSNLPKWLPMCSSARVEQGTPPHQPSNLGDILHETLSDTITDSAGHKIVDKIYTVVAKIDTLYWLAVGTDANDPKWTRWIAHFSTFPLEGNKTLFVRVFQQACQNPENEEVDDVICAGAIQPGMEMLRDVVEREFHGAIAKEGGDVVDR